MRDTWVESPLIALDWSFVRAMPDSRLAFPSDQEYVIPEISLREAALSSHGDPVAMMRKLLLLVRQNRGTIRLARHIGHFLDFETAPGVIAPPGFIAFRDPPFGAFGALDGDLHALAARAKVVEAENPAYLAIQSEFETNRKQFAEFFRESVPSPESLSETPIERYMQFIRQEDTIAKWATKFGRKYRSQAWQTSLTRFPDEHAVGRWWRVAMWYWLRAARGLGKQKIRNDWEDSIYVFTASYCAEFWTRDKGAAEAVSVLFPQTRAVLK